MYTAGARPDDEEWDGARASKIGGLAIGVPGEIRGFEAAYKACGGGVSWERIFQPAVELAREFKVGKELSRRLNARWSGTNEGPTISEWMKDEEDWSEMFTNDGEFLQEGESVHREAYAQTLETIAKEGADVFYKKGSKIADSMIKTIKKAGGILTAHDLESYRPIVLPALEAEYRGRKYFTGHYPSGGPIIQLLLNTLDGYKNYAEEGKTGLGQHRFLEALKCKSCPSISVTLTVD
jgi:gamma-glutamyltranspeptidase/glutathione hydrolase/leukotriene-C4 hydrolase